MKKLFYQFSRRIDKDLFLLWFEKTNRYLVISESQKEIVDLFNKSSNLNSFSNNSNLLTASKIFKELSNLSIDLLSYNESADMHEESIEIEFNDFDYSISIEIFNRKITFFSNNNNDLLFFTSHLHHKQSNFDFADSEFHVYFSKDKIFLYVNKEFCYQWSRNEYHLFQGKLDTLILSSVHQIAEKDWLGIFHASALVKNNKSTMLIGDSGNGKSIASLILSKNSYGLLCDDICAVSRNGSICIYPNAVSVKSSAIEKVREYYDKSEFISSIKNFKGEIKYVYPMNQTKNLKHNYPIENIVYVKFSTKNNFKKVGLKKIIETIVNQSWLSPKKETPNFLTELLVSTNFYKLEYMNDSFLVDSFNKIYDK